jgi:hypothetical protein
MTIDPERERATGTTAIRNRANEVINGLSVLAAAIDPVYSEACADTGLTCRSPISEPELMVSLLHGVALSLNACGLADSGYFNEGYRHYLGEHGWQQPKLTGLPANWTSLSTRRLMQYVREHERAEAGEPDTLAVLSDEDLELIYEELDKRDDERRANQGEMNGVAPQY